MLEKGGKNSKMDGWTDEDVCTFGRADKQMVGQFMDGQMESLIPGDAQQPHIYFFFSPL